MEETAKGMPDMVSIPSFTPVGEKAGNSFAISINEPGCQLAVAIRLQSWVTFGHKVNGQIPIVISNAWNEAWLDGLS